MGLTIKSNSKEIYELKKGAKLDVVHLAVDDAAFNGRIALISDVHSEFYPLITELVLYERPDVLFICGDLVHGGRGCDNWDLSIEQITKIAKKIPVVISLGNHEYEEGDLVDFYEAFNIPNVTILKNSSVKIKDFYIYGYIKKIADCHFAPSNLLEDRKSTILMCHNPMHYINNPALKGFGFTVSGHCHGGQCRLFNLGLYAPGQGYFPRYTSGFHFDNTLYITRGVGNPNNRVRINNNREIVFINFEQ